MEPVDKQNTARVLFLVLAVICITFLHYRTGHLRIASHILFRELYFLPIILAGFWFGMKGAMAVSFSISILYLPYILSLPEGISGHNLDNIMQVVIFNIIGLLVGWLRNREKKQQLQRLEAESLAAMGKAVSCIAHDMKTPLMAIGGLMRQVRRRTEEKGLADKLELASAQVRRLEALVGDMLAFARPLQLQYRQGAVTDLIRDVMLIVEEKALQQEVRIRTDLQQEIPLLDYDPDRLQQALLNLVNNALEASPRHTARPCLTCCHSAPYVFAAGQILLAFLHIIISVFKPWGKPA
jgi:two-component system sensor histidine kinase HydH